MSQIDDLNAAQALIGQNIVNVNGALDNLQQSYLELSVRISNIPTGPDLSPNIALATQQAADVAALQGRVVFVQNELDALLPPS